MVRSNSYMRLLRSLRRTTTGHKYSRDRGFTLIEILISLVIAGLVVSGLLFVVVEMLRVDQREVALEEVQSDMQRAIDYIADDLREAIYVYDNPATVTAQLASLNDEIATNGAEPVLAFWRTDEIDVGNTSIPADCSTEGANEGVCNVIKARRASYTLVAYYQRPQYGPWEGAATLKRYELAQYDDLTAAGAAKYNLTEAYKSPLDGGLNDFAGWTPDSAATTSDGGSRTVLVDYVRAIDIDAVNAVDCEALTGDPEHVLAPANATNATGFFACIRPPVLVDGFRANQDVFLFLQGDATAASQFLQPASEDSRLPVLQTQVKLGGVIDRPG